MAITELRFGGYGGQGVIMAGMIVGKAAVIFDGKNSTLTQTFGPEARGSHCSCQVIVSDKRILYPYVTRPNILVTMSQDACNLFQPDLREDGMLFFEESLVKPLKLSAGIRQYSIPATNMAEELGRRLVTNIVMVGFFTAITGIVGAESARQAISSLVPKNTVELNLKAFTSGYEHGQKQLGR